MDKPVAFMFGGVFVLIVLAVWLGILSDSYWTAYASEHGCKKTGQKRQQVMFVDPPNPIFFDEYQWRCEDGELGEWVWR